MIHHSLIFCSDPTVTIADEVAEEDDIAIDVGDNIAPNFADQASVTGWMTLGLISKRWTWRVDCFVSSAYLFVYLLSIHNRFECPTTTAGVFAKIILLIIIKTRTHRTPFPLKTNAPHRF